MGRFLTENASGMTTASEPVAAPAEPLAAENVDYLYRHLRYDLLFNAAGGVLVGAGLWHTAERWRLLAWLCILFALIMGRALLRYRYLARGPDSSDARWLSPFTSWATATGLCWGGLCLVLAPNHDVASQVVALISNGTVQISAVACFSAYPRVLRYFVISASAPSIVYLLLLGDPAYLMAAVLASLYVAAILSAGRLHQRALRRSQDLRRENLALIGSLTSSNQRLQALTNELEERVRTRTVALQGELERSQRAQDDLRSNEQMFHLISESVSDMIAVWDRHGEQLYGSRSLTRALGRNGAAAGQPSFSAIEAEDLGRLRQALNDTLRTSAGRRLELRLRGTESAPGRIIDCAVEPVRDAAGEPDKVVIVARDVTQRRQEETALRAAKERLTLAIEATGQMLFDVDCTEKRAYLDTAWATFLGRGRTESTAHFMELFPLVPQEEHPMIYRQYYATLKGEIPEYQVEHRVRAADGEYRWVASRAKVVERDANGRALRMIGTNIDVTKRRASEATLRLAGLAFDNMAEGLVMLDGQGRILSVNTAFTRITGYAAADAIGKLNALWRSAEEPGSLRQEVTTALAHVGRWEGRYLDRRRSGATYPVWLSATAIRESDGQISHIVMVFSDVTQQERDAERMRHLAYHDALTGLGNRSLFFERAANAIQRAARHGRQLAVLFIDIDQFKAVNDSLGHHAGDTVLIELARRLKDELRGLDLLARLGGDEFAVVLDEIESPAGAGSVAAKLLLAVERPMHVRDHEVRMTASIGISCFPGDGDTAELLVQQADAAMYLAKHEGRNRYRFFSREITAGVIHRLALASGLKGALEREELRLFYQPSVDASDGRILGVEALLRWQHPERGLLSPVDFIHVAEETGVIDAIGRWVLRAACAQLKLWEDAGLAELSMKINLSPLQFRQHTLMGDVRDALAEAQVPPTQIEFEITESAAMQDPDRSVRVLREMRDIGIRVALDDFGTGHSSLSHLSRFPIQCLKIDRSFVAGLPADHKNVVIASSVASLCRNLGLDMVGEGVESGAQAAFLLGQGCQQMQGHLFSAACDAVAATTLLERPSRAEWVYHAGRSVLH